MIQGTVMAAAGRRTSHQNRSMLKTRPVSQGIHPDPGASATEAGVVGPGAVRCSQARSGTSATKTSGMRPALGKARLRRTPDAAAASGPAQRPRLKLMEPDLAASLGGLIDGVDDPHHLQSLLGRGLRFLTLRDAAEEVLELIGLLVEVTHRVERRRDVLEPSPHLLVDPERMEERRALGAVEIEVGKVLLQQKRPA